MSFPSEGMSELAHIPIAVLLRLDDALSSKLPFPDYILL
jgi:hypothetical protein